MLFLATMEKEYLFKSVRLGFRNWLESDVEPMTLLNADPINMEFFENTRSPKETREMVEICKERSAKNELFFYAVDRLDTNAFIGMIGFWRMTLDCPIAPCVEIGWRLDRAHWGLGFATEGAMACLENFWKRFPLEPVRAITSVLNKRSERVMMKLGMKQIAFFEHPKVSEGHRLRLHTCYEIKNPSTS